MLATYSNCFSKALTCCQCEVTPFFAQKPPTNAACLESYNIPLRQYSLGGGVCGVVRTCARLSHCIAHPCKPELGIEMVNDQN